MAVIGVFIAIGLFWKNLHPESTPYISYLCFLITIPLFLEIRKGYDYEKSSWNLVVFIELFQGILAFTVYYLIVDYPNHLERILGVFVFTIIYLPFVTLVNKFLAKMKTDQYNRGLELTKKMEEVNLPIDKRNEIMTKSNIGAVRFYRGMDIANVVLVVLTIFACLGISAFFNQYLHATFDIILDRSPNIEAPASPSPNR